MAEPAAALVLLAVDERGLVPDEGGQAGLEVEDPARDEHGHADCWEEIYEAPGQVRPADADELLGALVRCLPVLGVLEHLGVLLRPEPGDVLDRLPAHDRLHLLAGLLAEVLRPDRVGRVDEPTIVEDRPAEHLVRPAGVLA